MRLRNLVFTIPYTVARNLMGCTLDQCIQGVLENVK